MHTSDPIHVVSAANAEYVPHVAAMLHSAFQSNSGESLQVHFLHRPELNEELIGSLRDLCRRHGADLRPIAVPAERAAGLADGTRYPVEAWYRVLLPSLLPELDRVLWLDADLLVLDSLRPLWNLDLEGKPIAAVRNALAPHHRAHPEALGMPAGRWGYFNTGVMVLDLARMRASDAESRLAEAAARLRSQNRFAEQDVFNPVFAGDFRELPLCWNVTAGSYIYVREGIRVHGFREFRRATTTPKIVHFTLHKPWLHGTSHPYRDRYLAHRHAAGWPAPETAVSPTGAILRRLPMIWRVLFRQPGRVGAGDMLLSLGLWLSRPRLFLQRRR